MGLVDRVRSAVGLAETRTYDTGVYEAVGTALMPATAAQVRRTGYEYGIPLGTASTSQQVARTSERQQTMNQLYQAYLACIWVAAPIDVIARTVTAGGLQIVTDAEVKEGETPQEPTEVTALRRLIKFTNPTEDMVQLLRNVVTDLMLFGDAYLEVVTLLGQPVALYTLDATTMTAISDQHGEVLGYSQDVDGVRTAKFDVNQVIHISLDAPRGGLYGVSPAQKALLPITAWLFWEATLKECGRRGDPPRIHIDLKQYQDKEVQTFREQYRVFNLGPKAVGEPVITTGDGIVNVLDSRKVTDYLDATRQLRDEIISTFGVPPSKLGIIETGNLGGGTGEAQNKSFQVNTVIPVTNLLLEKLNYHLVQVGFGITGWHLEFKEIDFRDSKVVEDIRTQRFLNGAYCVDEKTEILTATGWVRYDGLAAGDSVLTLNHETGQSQWQECQEVCVFSDETRDMVRMKTRVHSSLTTPNHRWPVERLSKGSWSREWTTSAEIRLRDRLVTSAPCADVPTEAIYDDAFVELIAWFWTEGHAAPGEKRVSVYQVKPEGVERIRRAFEKAFGPVGVGHGHKAAWSENKPGSTGKVAFRVAATHGHLFRDLVKDHVVSVGFIRALTREQLDLFIEVSLLADGHNAKSGQETIGQKRKEAAERFQLACILAGRSSTMRKRTCRDGYVMWEVGLRRTEGVLPVKAARTSSKATVEVVEHNGIVWCPRTPNQSWLARRDGTVYFTGNTVNRWRDEIGEPPIPGGDVAIIETRRGIVAWDDMEAMSKASVGMNAAPLIAAGVDGYIPGMPDARVPEPPTMIAPPLGMPPAKVAPNPEKPKDKGFQIVPGGPNDAGQGTPPKEDAYDRDNRRLDEAWQHAYRARRKQALKELP